MELLLQSLINQYPLHLVASQIAGVLKIHEWSIMKKKVSII